MTHEAAQQQQHAQAQQVQSVVQNRNNRNPNEISLYGSNDFLSGSSDSLSDDDLALIQKANDGGVRTQDGDEQIDVDLADEPTSAEQTESDGQQPTDRNSDQSDGTKRQQQQNDLPQKISESQQALSDISADLRTKSVDPDALMAEFNANGGLKPESYTALEKAGYTKAVVDSIIAGQVAVANSFANALLDAVGGQQGLEQIAQYALQHAPDAVEAYNNAVERRDLVTAKAVLNGIKAQRTAAYGTQGTRMVTAGSPVKPATAAVVAGFQSRQDMVKAMSDPKYGRDPAYTKKVEAQVAGASFF